LHLLGTQVGEGLLIGFPRGAICTGVRQGEQHPLGQTPMDVLAASGPAVEKSLLAELLEKSRS
jgi:hypothetical protein